METKPAIYTSELLITLVVLIVNLLNLVGIWDFVTDRVSNLMIAIVTAGYAVGRGIAKQGVAADPNVPANYKLLPRAKDMHPRR